MYRYADRPLPGGTAKIDCRPRPRRPRATFLGTSPRAGREVETMFAISTFIARYEWYIPVRQVAGTRTVRYQAVLPKIDRRRSIEREKGKKKKKRKKKKKKRKDEQKNTYRPPMVGLQEMTLFPCLRSCRVQAHRESAGTVSLNDGRFRDPIAEAEELAFGKACARFGFGLHLYHEDETP
ncbi:hypothetical protein GW17_00048679 [Ensete ventricosum]|nr:hypothetical protein GW17_00048679 [Ensete ventricosum]